MKHSARTLTFDEEQVVTIKLLLLFIWNAKFDSGIMPRRLLPTSFIFIWLYVAHTGKKNKNQGTLCSFSVNTQMTADAYTSLEVGWTACSEGPLMTYSNSTFFALLSFLDIFFTTNVFPKSDKLFQEG